MLLSTARRTRYDFFTGRLVARLRTHNRPPTPCADLGFYKGGCPIHLKGAPPPHPPIILTHVTGTKQFFGLRRNSWRQAVVRHLELCQIPY